MKPFTAADAQAMSAKQAAALLDARIAAASQSRVGNSAYMRIYAEDWFAGTLREEMEARGFVLQSDYKPPILKADVWFSW